MTNRRAVFCTPGLVTLAIASVLTPTNTTGAADNPSALLKEHAPTNSSSMKAADANRDREPGLKIHPAVRRRFEEGVADDWPKVWVLFTDKGIDSREAHIDAIDRVAATYHPRATERRRERRSLPGTFDWHDIPVAQSYVDAVGAAGADVHIVSSWVNGVSVTANEAQIQTIATLPFVKRIQPVRRGRKIEPTEVRAVFVDRGTGTPDLEGNESSPRTLNYGQSQTQLAQMNLIAVHDQGYTADGVVIGILDTGFERSHEAFNDPSHPVDILAEWDFVDDDGDTSFEPGDPGSQHNHGTYILGTLAAYNPGVLIGAAFDASFILCKTEDTTGEYPAEEDNYVAGLQFIEANGGDMATSSLGYIDWYTQEDLDGMTAVTTIAVNIATANGVHCCTAAGNGGHDTNPSTSHLIAPSDAPQVIACGAVNSSGTIASFSSDGPSADGRVKPEVLARGVDTRTVSPSDGTGYVGVNGTSLSTPLVAGAVACLIDAHPTWTVDQMRTYLFRTAEDYVENGTFDHRFIRGFGVVDALAASAGDCNGNGIDDDTDIDVETSEDCNGNGVPDECDVDPVGGYPDCNKNDAPDSCDLADGTSADADGNGIPDECQTPPALVPTQAPWPHNVSKNRYISFAPNNGGNSVAFQVAMVEGPGAPMSLGWVGEPDANGVSRVVSGPVAVTRVWAESVVHVGDCEIVPRAIYEIRATADGIDFTSPLLVPTIAQPTSPPLKWWGDIVGAKAPGGWTAPDGFVNMDDIQAAVHTFETTPGAPHWTWVDVEDEIPNQVVNLTDVQFILLAFESAPYPFRDPADCP